MTPRVRLYRRFLTAFCGGRLEELGELLTDDFQLHGPLLEVTGRDAYLARLASDPPEAGAELEILEIHEAGGDVFAYWRYGPAGRKPLLIASWCKFRGRRIAEMRLVFDARGLG